MVLVSFYEESGGLSVRRPPEPCRGSGRRYDPNQRIDETPPPMHDCI